MKSIRVGAAALLSVVLAAGVALVGCSDNKPTGGGASKSDAGSKDGGTTAGSAASTPKAGLTAVAAKGTGTLKGTVKYQGTPPAAKPIEIPADNKDKDYCLKGGPDETTDPTWRVGPNGGVADVVVWLKAPAGHYFDVPEAQRKPASDIATVDQPHCAFVPHVQTMFPSYFDGKMQVATGQKFNFKIANSATIAHNTNLNSKNPALDTESFNQLIPAKEQKMLTLMPAPASKTGEDLVTLKCNIHTWMKGYIWVFDHPYAAVTDKEGNFEIKNAPAGAEVSLMYWHDSFGEAPKSAKKVTLKAGDNKEDLQVGK
jgi:hypothetical protein